MAHMQIIPPAKEKLIPTSKAITYKRGTLFCRQVDEKTHYYMLTTRRGFSYMMYVGSDTNEYPFMVGDIVTGEYEYTLVPSGTQIILTLIQE